jgi:hypothetical protein
MARRTGQRDRGGGGFLVWWPQQRWGGTRRRWPGCGRCRRDLRHARRRGERERMTGVPKGINELSGKVLKIRMN